MNQKESLDELKLFVSKLINEEQEKYSKKVEDLTAVNAETGLQSVSETIKVLNLLYKAKTEVLEKVYKEIQKLQ